MKKMQFPKLVFQHFYLEKRIPVCECELRNRMRRHGMKYWQNPKLTTLPFDIATYSMNLRKITLSVYLSNVHDLSGYYLSLSLFFYLFFFFLFRSTYTVLSVIYYFFPSCYGFLYDNAILCTMCTFPFVPFIRLILVLRHTVSVLCYCACNLCMFLSG